jgi:hypothetical protein
MSPPANNNSGGKTRFRDFTMVSYTYKRGYDGKHMLRTLVLVGELTLAGLAVVWRMGSSGKPTILPSIIPFSLTPWIKIA